MAKREINIFSVSFIDLLSGALGAVLILFVVVPKLTSDIERQLEELEQIKELKVDVQKIESMMTKLKKSVPDGVYKELESRIKKTQETIDDLALEVKNLQNKLAKCDDKTKKLKEEKKQQEQRIKELEDEINNNGSLVKQLKEEIESQKKQHAEQVKKLEEQIKQTELEKAELQKKVETTEKQVTTLQVQTQDMQKEITQVKTELDKAKETNARQAQEIAQFKNRLGFELGDKNVVFVVDMSGSMDDEPEPQKITEVTAGIKMMIATMSDDYAVDIVSYPKSKDERYRYKYGKLTKVTEKVKYDLYNHLSKLRAYGCTPTKEAMDFVLTSPNYADAGTIILMSDGLPTVRVGATKCDDMSNTKEVEDHIRNLNAGKRVINCIGVGKDFRTASSNDPKVKFMKQVAKENKGFYIGF